MSDDIEPSVDEVARWTRNLLKPARGGQTDHTFNPDEAKMIAKVFGTTTQAEQFLRHEARKPDVSKTGRIDIRRPATFKPRAPIVRFEYYERREDHISLGCWTIERFENGKSVKRHTGQDWQKRDDLLIKLQSAGFTCTPITVAGVVPAPIRGRMRARTKKPSARTDIMKSIGKLTSDDIAAYEQEDGY